MASTHPWECHLNVRPSVNQSRNLSAPSRHPAPRIYSKKEHIIPPDPFCARSHRECTTLADVIAFRANHSPSSIPCRSLIIRPVLYRNTDALKGKGEYTIIEAIHFEVFMPDRKDLRFVAVKSSSMPRDSVEGYIFAVYDLEPLQRPLVSLTMQDEYPITWRVISFEKMPIKDSDPITDIVYVANIMESGDARGVGVWSPSYITLKAARSTEELIINRIYEATIIPTSSAWIYPVEPPRNRADYAKLVANVRSSSLNTGIFAIQIHDLPDHLKEMLRKRLQVQSIPESFLLHLFKLGINYRILNTPPERFNVRIKQIDPPELIVLSEVYGINRVTIHHFPNNAVKKIDLLLNVNSILHPTRGNNRHSILKCAPMPRMKELFPIFAKNKKPAKLPLVSASLHSDPNTITMDTINIIEKVLEEININNFNTREGTEQITLNPPELCEYLYSKVDQKVCGHPFLPSSTVVIKTINSFHQFFDCESSLLQPLRPPKDKEPIARSNGIFTPNERQSEAIGLYNAMKTPAFCILSPPGSGKTTVAAAMAISLEKRKAPSVVEVQLLLAVQNSAVNNLTASFQTFDVNNLECYHMQSKARSEADSDSLFGIKTLLSKYELHMLSAEDTDLKTVKHYLEVNHVLSEAKSTLSSRRKYKLGRERPNLMQKAKLALEKYFRPQIIFSTVDLLLCHAKNQAGEGMGRILRGVTRIIIDEASLLTESTFYCLVRLFPTAKFVLIGDDKQLPPFMFDGQVVAHVLTARSALFVAMENRRLPVINLVEVYRAPPQLIAPYNDVSYGGTLISRKTESSCPLTSIGLVPQGHPQLLLIGNQSPQNSGSHQSLWNKSEIEEVTSLLEMFPEKIKSEIMIICLYKEQKRKLEILLGTDYELHTVDSSQGKEKSIVIVLTSRSDKSTPFFESRPRCTVAISRHRTALIIIGNYSLLARTNPWKTVIESSDFTVISKGMLRTASEEMKARLEELILKEERDEMMTAPSQVTYESEVLKAERKKENKQNCE